MLFANADDRQAFTGEADEPERGCPRRRAPMLDNAQPKSKSGKREAETQRNDE
jgi:hypothetical protein